MARARISVVPPLPFSLYRHSATRAAAFPLDEQSCRLYARGRHALWAGVRWLGIRPGEEVLAPAYHEGPEIEALRRAGVRCRFYDVGECLEPDEEELERLAGPGVRALYLIHYFGIAHADAGKWRRWWKCPRGGYCSRITLRRSSSAMASSPSSWRTRSSPTSPVL